MAKEDAGWYADRRKNHTYYTYVGKDNVDRGWEIEGKGAEIIVDHNYDFPNFGKGSRVSPGVVSKVEPEDEPYYDNIQYGTYQHALKWTKDNELVHPDTLFTHVPPRVSWASANTGFGAKVVIGMGIAAHEMGEAPIPDEDLSATSSRISQKGIERGYIQPNTENSEALQTNTIEPEDSVNYGLVTHNHSKVSEDTVRAGWRKVKSVMGKNSMDATRAEETKPARSPEVPGQMRLF